jgi:glycosyltransferase involved in cell wall biosynthesis
VTVVVTAYNQAPWIAQALDSAVRQDSSVAFEVVVGDDDSSDGTRAVAERFVAAHPSRVRLLPAGARIGMHANLQRGLRAARGEYIAMLNGDDYWVSPHKLKVQVEALDAHPGWSMCFHPVRIVGENSEILTAVSGPAAKATFGTRDLLRGNFVATCSAVFRRRLALDLPEWFADLPMGDWTLWLALSQHGPLGYLHSTMAAYRVRADGVWSGKTEHDRLAAAIRFLMIADRHLDGRFAPTINRSLSFHYRLLGQELEKAGRCEEARVAFRRAVAHNRLNLTVWRRLGRLALDRRRVGESRIAKFLSRMAARKGRSGRSD